MRSRNCFALLDKEGNYHNYYSGSWNLKELNGKCEDKDIISEFNPSRENFSQEEKYFSDDMIKNNYTEDRDYEPKDFIDNPPIDSFWNFLENTFKAKPSEKEIFGRKFIDFYKGGEMIKKPKDYFKNASLINKEKLIEKHSILLLARFVLTEEGIIKDNFFDEIRPKNLDATFMFMKTKNRQSIFDDCQNLDLNIEFNKIIPYLIVNVLTNYDNRIGFDHMGENGQLYLDDILTKDEILLI